MKKAVGILLVSLLAGAGATMAQGPVVNAVQYPAWLERNGVSEEAQTALKQAFKILFREGLTIPNAISRIEAELPKLPEILHLLNFARTSERGNPASAAVVTLSVNPASLTNEEKLSTFVELATTILLMPGTKFDMRS